MNVLRWLFSHPIAFAWILAILAILLNLGISGNDHGDGKHGDQQQQASAEGHGDDKHGDGDDKHGDGDNKHDDGKHDNKHEGHGETDEKQADAKTTEDTTSTDETATDQQQATAAAATTAVAATAAVAATTTQETTQETGDTSQTENAQAEVSKSEGSMTDKMLRDARQAYWDNNMQEAIARYKMLIAQDDSPSHKGELANVYWKLGQGKEAAELYLQIGSWLKEQGRTAELINMKVYVEMTNPDLAKQIEALLK